MINLIPLAAKKSLVNEYWVRAISVWFVLWAGAILLGIFILVPSYVLITSQVSAYQDSAKSASEKIENYEKVAEELTRSGKWAAMMNENFALQKTSDYISLFHSLEQNGITISNISIERTDKGIAPIVISGVADDRQTLASFRDRVVAQEVVSSVDLPISNLAKDKDIPFEISVTINNAKTL